MSDKKPSDDNLCFTIPAPTDINEARLQRWQDEFARINTEEGTIAALEWACCNPHPPNIYKRAEGEG